jgi:hypothetical protein
MVKKRCFHLSLRWLLNYQIRLHLTYVMLHIISFQNMSKNSAKLYCNIIKIKFFQTHLIWSSYGPILTTDYTVSYAFQ